MQAAACCKRIRLCDYALPSQLLRLKLIRCENACNGCHILSELAHIRLFKTH